MFLFLFIFIFIILWSIAGVPFEPGASGLPYYCTSICVALVLYPAALRGVRVTLRKLGVLDKSVEGLCS